MKKDYRLQNIHNRGRKIYLFLRDEKGKQKVEIVNSFFPYYYEPVLYEEEGECKGYLGHSLKKLFVSKPSEVRRKRSNEAYEADIIFTKRFLTDRVNKILQSQPKIGILDIEVLADEFPKPEDAKYPISCISVYNNFKKNIKTFFLPNYETEFQMLQDFMEYIKEEKFDILTGWNMISFDYLYLYNRIPDFAETISPIGQSRYGSKDVNYPAGTSIVDYLSLYKKLTLNREKEYSLDYIAQKKLGKEPKEEVDFNELDEKLKEHNINDVKWLAELERKTGLFEYYDTIRRLTKIEWEDLLWNSRSLDSLLLNEARIQNIALPMKPNEDRGTLKEKGEFKGAFRQIYKSGRFENVAKLDLSSAYPSIIVDFCLDTTNLTTDSKNSTKINKVYFKQNQDALLPLVTKKLMNMKEKEKSELSSLNPETQEYKDSELKYKAIKTIVNSCFTGDTDILTTKGIKNIKEAKVGDKVYNINPKTLEIEIDEIIDTQEFDYTGDLYHYKSTRADVKVTENHKFLIKQNGKVDFRTASDLYKNAREHWCIPKINPIKESEKIFSLYDMVKKIDYYKEEEENNWQIQLNTSSKKVFLDFLKLIVLLGHNNIRYDKDFTKKHKNNYCYRLYYGNNNKKIKRQLKKESYTGKVYCVTTKKNHTVFAGRNKTFIPIGQSFGVCGNRFFRLYNLKVASTITYLIRDLLRYTIDEFKKKGYETIYVDTDSVFISNCKEDISELANSIIKKWAKEKYNKDIRYTKFEFEGYFENVILLALCRYVGNLKTNKGIKLEAKGVESKRKDSTKFITKFHKNIINKILEGESKDKIFSWIRKQIKEIEKRPLQEIAHPAKLSKTLEDYKNTPIFARAVRDTKNFKVKLGENFYYTFIKPEEYSYKEKNILTIKGEKLTPSKLIPYWEKLYGEKVYVKDMDKEKKQELILNLSKEGIIENKKVRVKDRPIDVIAFNEKNIDSIDKNKLDWSKIKERNIYMKLITIFEAMGWDLKEIKNE